MKRSSILLGHWFNSNSLSYETFWFNFVMRIRCSDDLMLQLAILLYWGQYGLYLV